MNVNHAGVEALSDHEHLIRAAQDDDLVTIQMRANTEVVVRVAGPDRDEARVVATTVGYLIVR